MTENSDHKMALTKRLANDEDWIEPVEKIPAWVKPFVGKTPAEFLGDFIAHEKLEALAGAMYGFTDSGIPIPEWSKKASIQFWKHFVGNKPLRPTESAEDFGVLVVLIERFTQGCFSTQQMNKPASKLEKFLSSIAKKVYLLLRDKILSKLSHEEKAEFYIGCSRGEQIIARMQNPDHLAMVKRAPVYIVIASAWRQFEKFPSHAAAERWLRSEKVIGDEEKFSSREVYAIFEVIKLPGATAGRPKNPETRRGEIAKS